MVAQQNGVAGGAYVQPPDVVVLVQVRGLLRSTGSGPGFAVFRRPPGVVKELRCEVAVVVRREAHSQTVDAGQVLAATRPAKAATGPPRSREEPLVDVVRQHRQPGRVQGHAVALAVEPLTAWSEGVPLAVADADIDNAVRLRVDDQVLADQFVLTFGEPEVVVRLPASGLHPWHVEPDVIEHTAVVIEDQHALGWQQADGRPCKPRRPQATDHGRIGRRGVVTAGVRLAGAALLDPLQVGVVGMVGARDHQTSRLGPWCLDEPVLAFRLEDRRREHAVSSPGVREGVVDGISRHGDTRRLIRWPVRISRFATHTRTHFR